MYTIGSEMNRKNYNQLIKGDGKMDSLQSIIYEINKGGRIFKNDLPAKQEGNARNSYKIPSNEEIILLVDITLFKSAKDGAAFCGNGCYWHEFLGSANKVMYHDLYKYNINFINKKCILKGFDHEIVINVEEPLNSEIEKTLNKIKAYYYPLPQIQEKIGNDIARLVGTADANIKSGNYDAALTAIDNALWLNPELEKLILVKGDLKLLMHCFTEAEAEYRRALDKNGNPDIINEKIKRVETKKREYINELKVTAKERLTNKKFEETYKIIDDILGLDPKNIDAFKIKFQGKIIQFEFTEANNLIETLKELKLDVNELKLLEGQLEAAKERYIQLKMQKAKELKEQNSYQAAFEELGKALNISENHIEANILLADLKVDTKDFSEALNIYNKYSKYIDYNAKIEGIQSKKIEIINIYTEKIRNSSTLSDAFIQEMANEVESFNIYDFNFVEAVAVYYKNTKQYEKVVEAYSKALSDHKNANYAASQIKEINSIIEELRIQRINLCKQIACDAVEGNSFSFNNNPSHYSVTDEYEMTPLMYAVIGNSDDPDTISEFSRNSNKKARNNINDGAMEIMAVTSSLDDFTNAYRYLDAHSTLKNVGRVATKIFDKVVNEGGGFSTVSIDYEQYELDEIVKKYKNSRKNFALRFKEAFYGWEKLELYIGQAETELEKKLINKASILSNSAYGKDIYNILLKNVKAREEKDEFETTSEYEERIEKYIKDNRETLEAEFSDEINELINRKKGEKTGEVEALREKIEKSKQTLKNYKDILEVSRHYFFPTKRIKLLKYNADNESFGVEFDDIILSINIPRKDAKSFKENFETIVPEISIKENFSGKNLCFNIQIRYNHNGIVYKSNNLNLNTEIELS